MARLVFSMDTLLSSDRDTRASAAGYPVVDTRAEVATALLVDFSGSTVTKEKIIFNNNLFHKWALDMRWQGV